VTKLRDSVVAEPRTAADRRPASAQPRRRLQRILPGDVWVWRAAGIVIAILGVLLFAELLKPREYFLGSNSVAARDYVAGPVHGGETLCVRDIRVPSGTQRVRWGIDTQDKPRVPIDMSVRIHGGPMLHGSVVRSPTPGFHKVDIPMTQPVPGGAPFRTADLCLVPHGGGQIFVWGRTQLDNSSKPIQVGKHTFPNRAALWFLPLEHERRSILSQLGPMFDRASLFRPGFVGPWTFWLVLFGAMPLLIYAGIRVVASADTLRSRRFGLPVRVFAIAFALAAMWALITPAFESPDESEHMAAVQYLAETGHAVDSVQGKRAPWSTQEAWAIDQTRELSTIERPEAKAPWLEAQQKDWERGSHGLPKDNGGGFHPVTSAHTPAYYSLLLPAYFATRGSSPFTQLLAMRLTSALMGAAIALLATLLILELVPTRRSLAAAAGLLIAFLPQFGFISGAVNNDNGVNLGAALIIYLLIRALRRGWTAPVAVALGFALVVTPLLKGTGYELYPPVAIALIGVVLRRHGRRDLALLALAAVSFIVFFVGWEQLSTTFHRSTFATPGGGTPGVSFAARQNLKAYAVWLWQVMLPFKLGFMQDFTVVHWPFFNIYVMRGFAGFGWYAIFLSKWVYGVVVAVMGIVLAGAIALLWRERAGALRRYVPEILFLASVPVVVVAAVEAAYFTLAIPTTGVAEQGRYAFPAITALSAIVIAGCLGLGGRRGAAPIAAALVAGLAMMTYAGQFLTLSTFYT
jgi:Predicted membrane protein (DUF2142)